MRIFLSGGHDTISTFSNGRPLGAISTSETLARHVGFVAESMATQLGPFEFFCGALSAG